MRFAIAIHPKVLMTWAVVGLVGALVKTRLSKQPVEEDTSMETVS